MSTGDQFERSYSILGELIRRQTPYGQGTFPEGLDPAADPPNVDPTDPQSSERPTSRDGFLRDNKIENPYTGPIMFEDPDQLKCVWWYYGGKARRVTKAMRVEYTYTRSDQRTVTTHLLIGYEGSGDI